MRATVVSAEYRDGGRGAGNEAELGDGEAGGFGRAGCGFGQPDETVSAVLPEHSARAGCNAGSGLVDDEVVTRRQVGVEHFRLPATGPERSELVFRQRQDK
jgi:hypothetical protein